MLVPAMTSTGMWCCSNQARTPISRHGERAAAAHGDSDDGAVVREVVGGTEGSSGPRRRCVVLAAVSPVVAGLLEDLSSVPVLGLLVGASLVPAALVS